MKEASIEVNDLVQVRLLGEDDTTAYPSRVDDLLGRKLYLSWPTDRGIRVPVHKDQKVSLFLVREDAVYAIEGIVEERIVTPIPRIIVETRGVGRRIQRREYFRVRVMLPVELIGSIAADYPMANVRDTLLHLTTETVDISGAGLAIHHRSQIPVGTILDVKLSLKKDEPALKLLARVVSCEVVKHLPGRQVYHVGLNFLSMAENQRAEIVRQVFRLQQESLIT